jgi:DNA-binding winged helix-turn-helix (wHTH) protein
VLMALTEALGAVIRKDELLSRVQRNRIVDGTRQSAQAYRAAQRL